MKTRMITTVLISMMMFASVNVFGGKPLRTMSFYSLRGIVEIPVKVEEAPDSLPAVVKVAIIRNQIESRCNAVNMQFDLSQITKPEPDADDVAINTKQVFEELRYREFARK